MTSPPRSPKNLKLLKLLALGYAKNGLLEKSAECAFQAQEREPADYELLGAIVTLDPARALTRLNDMLSRPTWAEDDEIQGARANALLATGDATGAFEAYAKASSIDPRDTDWLRGLAEADPARALPLLLARQADDPGSDVAAALAIAYATTGAPEPAAAQFHRAVGSSDPSAWCAAAYARVEPEGALAWVTQWVESNPKDADRHAALGDVYRQLGRTEEARAAYAEAERRAPTHVGAALRRVRGR